MRCTARWVRGWWDFSGYALPLRYPAGIIAEHMACRNGAALFDVSHMGQAMLHGARAADALERLVPGDIAGLAAGRQRYTLLTNEAGGILDDLMAARLAPDRVFLVVNASRKDADFRHLAASLPDDVTLEIVEDRALIALQGPEAGAMLGRIAPGSAALGFLGVARMTVAGAECVVSRSGYTGEDGFEISVPAAAAEAVARTLLDAGAAPAGLGARDSLRLEAGLCLYGSDIDELTTPVEAGLAWAIGKRHRESWDFLGGAAIRDQIEHGAHRRRVGIRPDGQAPLRAGVTLAATDGTAAGSVTSGGFSPSLNAPIAMGYVRRDLAAPGTALLASVRGQLLPARVVALPFVPHRYKGART